MSCATELVEKVYWREVESEQVKDHVRVGTCERQADRETERRGEQRKKRGKRSKRQERGLCLAGSSEGAHVAQLTVERHLETGDAITALVEEAGFCHGGN